MVIWIMKALTMTNEPTVIVPAWTSSAVIAITPTRPATMISAWPEFSSPSEVAVLIAAT